MVGNILEPATIKRTYHNFMAVRLVHIPIRPYCIHDEFDRPIFLRFISHNLRVGNIRSRAKVKHSSGPVLVSMTDFIIGGLLPQHGWINLKKSQEDIFEFFFRHIVCLSCKGKFHIQSLSILHLIHRLENVIEIQIAIIILAPVLQKQIIQIVPYRNDIFLVQLPAILIQGLHSYSRMP